MDTDGSMTVDWDEFLQHVILKPVDDIGELVSSWKHSLVRLQTSLHPFSIGLVLIRVRGELEPITAEFCCDAE